MANFSQEDIDNNNVLAAAVIFPFLFLIYFITSKKSEYVRYCANQGVVFTGGFIIISVAAKILSFIPLIGWIFWFVDMALFILMVIQMIGAFGGGIKDLPVIGEIKIF